MRSVSYLTAISEISSVIFPLTNLNEFFNIFKVLTQKTSKYETKLNSYMQISIQILFLKTCPNVQ